jgi:hypothetical protein
MQEIIFCLPANYFMGHFKGYFEGSKKTEPPQNISLEDMIESREYSNIVLKAGVGITALFFMYNIVDGI